jgi:hypothetical protein
MRRREANDVIEIVDLTKDERVCIDVDNDVDDEVKVLGVKRCNGDSDSEPELVSSVSSTACSDEAAYDLSDTNNSVKSRNKRPFVDVGQQRGWRRARL